MRGIPRTFHPPGDGPLQAELKRRDAEISGAINDLVALPLHLPSYTVLTLPSASKWAQCLIYVSDGTTNKRLAVSDGAAWRFPDGNVVS